MEVELGGNKRARITYGFDEVAVVPGTKSIDPADVDTTWTLGDLRFAVPVLASAMDGAVGPELVVEMGRLGGLAVLNLEGVFTRYDDPEAAIGAIIAEPPETVVSVIQEVYRAPVRPELIAKRVRLMKSHGYPVAVSATPVGAVEYAPAAVDAGADVFVIQATVTSIEHRSELNVSVRIADFCKSSKVPVIVGNVCSYAGAMSLMEAGADAVLVGVGPGAACTTRKVCGIGVPQVTATADAAAARDDFEKRTGKRVAVVCDGGMRTGGDVVKAIVSGADAVMIGSPIAMASEAPGKGYHWGMSTSHAGLPRGTRIHVGTKGSLEQILFGPARQDDGTLNLVGALRLAMSYCGAANIREMQQAEMVVAPALPTEGKAQQRAQGVGQWR